MTVDESQVDAILEAAGDDDSGPSSSGRCRAERHANGASALHGNPRAGAGVNGREHAVGRVLGNGWKKYYIDPTDVVRHEQLRETAPFERGSSQRVTLPLATGLRESAVGGGGILAQRCQPGRRSSRDAPGECSSTFAARRDATEVSAAECRTPTVGFALPVSLAVRPPATSLLASGRSSGKTSVLLTPSSRRAAAAHSADAQRGERLSNYHRGTIPRPGSAGHASGYDTESVDDDDVRRVDPRRPTGGPATACRHATVRARRP